MEQESVSVFGTGWKSEPSLQDLKYDLESTKSSHAAQMAKVETWRSNLNVKSTDNKVAGRSSVQPKLIRKQAEWRYTSLSEPFLNTPKVFTIDPVTYEDVTSAKQNELVINNQFNTKLDKINFVDTLVRRAVDEGTAAIRAGWKAEYEKVNVEYPQYAISPTDIPDEIALLQQAVKLDASQQEPQVVEAVAQSLETGIPHWYYPTGEIEVVEETKLINNHPTAIICELDNLYIDPSCGDDLDKAEFLVYSFETSKSELKKSDLYSNVDSISVGSNSVLGDPDHTSDWASGGENFRDDARRKLVAYEYWGFYDIDGSGKTSPIVATWVGDTLIRMERNPYPDGKIPFILIPYLPVKDSVYGEPDGELLEDNQKILGAVTRGIIDLLAKSANSQTGFRKGALDVVNRRKYDKGLDYEYNSQLDAQQSIYMHTYPEVPMSAYNMISMQNQEAESLSGVKAFAQGISGAGLGDTATHARGALDAAARRENGILRRIASGMKKLGRKMIAMNQEFLDEEEVIRVTNKEFVKVRRDDLMGNFDLDLRIATAEADEQKAQELAFMLQTTGQNFGVGMFKMILSEIAELRRMPHLAESIRAYQPEPNPIDQELGKLEVEAKQLENAKIQAEINKLNAEAAAAGSRANNLQADTDKKNLDFVEQEAGIAHQRNLEKDSAQASANIELEATKAFLNQKPTEKPSQGLE